MNNSEKQLLDKENLISQYEVSNQENEVNWMYTNAAEIQCSPYDFNLKLTNMITNEKINILMSPQHAKSLKVILENAILNYEKQIGNISNVMMKKEGK